MTIQRQYTLPNCNLIVEGLTTDASDPASPLSVLMNVECRLPNATDAPLTGGREFLDSLVVAVSQYAQQLLSGIPRPIAPPSASPPLVDLKPGEGAYHHLIVREQVNGEPATDVEATPPLDVKLSTIQFYDLMEAVDQLLADALTLPDLQPQFQSVPRRQVKPAEPVAKRAVPAAIGAATLAAAGLAFFFVPPPNFEPSRSSTESDVPAETTTPGLTDTAGTTPDTDVTDTEPLVSDPEATAETASTTGTNATSEAETATTDPAAAVDRLADTPTITDAATLALLQSDLRRTLADAWTADLPPAADLEYRVTVAEDGDILGYKYQNNLALEAVDTTSLPEVAFSPLRETDPIPEAVAQFLVTFSPDGDVSVEPLPGSANADAEAVDAEAVETVNSAEATDLPPIDEPITDNTTVNALVQTLRGEIADNLEPLSANQDLTYRVRLAADGEVTGYVPVDAESRLLADETPLPDLVSPADGGEAEADFRVVFTEAGVIEVSPWDGWPQ